jgi:transcriptional regulator with XRE-family HTH domain
MRAIIGGMTLQDVLKRHGITRIKELAERAGLSNQHAWNLWHAQVGVGTEMLKRLHERLGIPLDELIQIDHVPAPKRQPRRQALPRAPARRKRREP